jgi:hypothetical protein
MPFSLPELSQLQPYGVIFTIISGTVLLIVRLFGRSKVISFCQKIPPVSLVIFIYHKVNQPNEISAKIDAYHKDMSDRLDKVEKQLTPNGGSSVIDALHRIENNQIYLRDKQAMRDESDVKPSFEVKVTRDDAGEIEVEVDKVNPALCQLLGYPAEQLLVTSWFSKIDASERNKELTLWREAADEEMEFNSHHHLEHGLRNERLHLKVYARPSFDLRGRVVRYIGHASRIA